MANTLTTNEGEVRERGGAGVFADLEDALLSPLMDKVGELTREYMPENGPPLDAPIAGITPAMIEAGAPMAVEVFRGKVTEGDARLWVGEIYAAMRAMAPNEPARVREWLAGNVAGTTSLRDTIAFVIGQAYAPHVGAACTQPEASEYAADEVMQVIVDYTLRRMAPR